MFALTDLRVPILSSPMAGGPSTPALVHAMNVAGGTGFLAAGYKDPDAISQEVATLRALGEAPFGVNLFVPAEDRTRTAEQVAAVQAYGEYLRVLCERAGCDIGTPDPADTDGWDAKIDWLLDLRVPIVSFMFGCPSAHVIARFHEVGTFVTVTVTDEQEAAVAASRGADALVVQGPDAGGHRGTHAVGKSPDTRPLGGLLQAIRATTSLPLVAAGGIADGADIAAMLDAGAAAVQVGTLLLRAPECGANPSYKAALASGTYARTVATRVFSGRVARVLENDLVQALDGVVPPAYPEVLHMMRGLRQQAVARGDTGSMAMFAGTGFRAAQDRPASDIVGMLWSEARAR